MCSVTNLINLFVIPANIGNVGCSYFPKVTTVWSLLDTWVGRVNKVAFCYQKGLEMRMHF